MVEGDQLERALNVLKMSLPDGHPVKVEVSLYEWINTKESLKAKPPEDSQTDRCGPRAHVEDGVVKRAEMAPYDQVPDLGQLAWRTNAGTSSNRGK
jgi:hypothetical protein